jgi:hypothetical protein
MKAGAKAAGESQQEGVIQLSDQGHHLLVPLESLIRIA